MTRSKAPIAGGSAAVLNLFQEHVERWLADPVLLAGVAVAGTEQGYEVQLHPAEEPLFITIENDDRVTVAAKTSSAGPGYHAFIVDTLDHWAELLATTWQWDDDLTDETGYAQHRDRRQLEAAMASFLAGLAEVVIDPSYGPVLRVSLPMTYPVVADGEGIMHATGLTPRSWFQDYLHASEHGRLLRCAGHFAWWDQGFTADTYRGIGLARCWLDVPWRQPVNDDEKQACGQALLAFDLARQTDPTINVPNEVNELAALVSGKGGHGQPSPEGIGFKRRLLRHDAMAEWSLVLPGYFAREVDQDGRELTFFWMDRAVRCRALRHADADPAANQTAILAKAPADAERHASDRVHGFATLAHGEDEGGPYASLDAVCVCGIDTLVVSITVPDANGLDWARTVWHSVDHPLPEEPRDA